MRQLFALHDSNPDDPSEMFPVDEETARIVNQKGYGIFWEVNSHDPKGKRGKRYLSQFLSCFCEFDELSKSDQWKLINTHVAPSMVIESKRGYQIYFDLIGEATPAKYNAIQARIIHFYGADKAVKDSSRVLRAPGFLHLKDPAKPYPIEVKYRSRAKYTVDEFMHFFPGVPMKNNPKRNETPIAFQKAFGGDLSQRIDSLGNQYALERLSGTPAVNCESIGFKDVAGGKKNILVNGKMTSCWIDESGRIGSHSHGGPTFAQWVNWYHQNWHTTFRYLREYLPELFS